jgi:calcineurin-like phosphoesterase family protein
MTVWYSADHHFFHEKIIKLAHRPFSSMEEMHEKMIANHNALVAPDDEHYILGDFIFGGTVEKARSILSRLNGIHHLVVGNHDARGIERMSEWRSTGQIVEIRDGGRHVVLCHYPMVAWPGSYGGSIHLYGHVHDRLPADAQSTDVGVDAWDFRPVTLDQALRRMADAPARSRRV